MLVIAVHRMRTASAEMNSMMKTLRKSPSRPENPSTSSRRRPCAAQYDPDGEGQDDDAGQHVPVGIDHPGPVQAARHFLAIGHTDQGAGGRASISTPLNLHDTTWQDYDSAKDARHKA
jgi:hypothetical protein